MTETLPLRPKSRSASPTGQRPERVRRALPIVVDEEPDAVAVEKSDGWGSLFSAVIIFFVLAVVLPMISVSWQDSVAATLNVVLVLVITTYSSFMIAKLCYNGGGQIIRLAFFVFLYVFMGLPVLAQVVTAQYPVSLPTTGAYGDGLVTRALEAVLLSIVMFEVGSLLPRLFGWRRRHESTRRVGRQAPRRFELSQRRVLVLSVLGLLATVVLIQRTGLGPFFDSRQALTDSVNGTNGSVKAIAATNKAQNTIFKFITQAPVLFSLFAMLYLRHHKLWKPGGDAEALLGQMLLGLLIVANLIVNNPISNSRFWFSMVAITLLSVYLPMNRSKGVRWAAILSILTLLLAFTTLDAFRRSGGAQDHSQGYRSDLVSSATYSAFTMEMIGLKYLHSNAHTDGYQLLGSVGIFVPRSIWTSKPVDTGNVVLPYANPAAPLWTEGEVDGGIGLMSVYFMLLGAGAAALDRRMRTAPVGTLVQAVTPVIAGLLIFVIRGSLAAAAAPGYAMAFSVWFIAHRVPVEVGGADPAEPV